MEQYALFFARDESLTLGLGDSEARMLIEALVFAVEKEPWRFNEFQRKAKLASRMVSLWTRRDFCGVAQLAASSRLEVVLPQCYVSNESFTERILMVCLK